MNGNGKYLVTSIILWSNGAAVNLMQIDVWFKIGSFLLAAAVSVIALWKMRKEYYRKKKLDELEHEKKVMEIEKLDHELARERLKTKQML